MLAIDFGTTNTVCAHVKQDRYDFLSFDGHSPGNKQILPSLLFFPDDQGVHFGANAVSAYTEAPESGRFIKSMKKFLPDIKFQGTEIHGKRYTLEQILGSFFSHIKHSAEEQVGQKIDQVLLGRPVRFSLDEELDEIAETRLVQSATLAGFKDISVLPEPVAASFASGVDTLTQDYLQLSVDLGGGTSDFTLTKVNDGDLDVLSMTGVPIAGDALDGRIMSQLVGPEFGTEVTYQLPLSDNKLKMPPNLKYQLGSPADINFIKSKKTIQLIEDILKTNLSDKDHERLDRLFVLTEDNLGFSVFQSVEACKIAASMDKTPEFLFDYPGIELKMQFTQEQVFDSSTPLIEKIFTALDECLFQGQVTINDLDRVIVTGGSAQYQPILRTLNAIFDGKIEFQNSYTAVCEGLAISAQKTNWS
jgi:hypothetical chaperone protein